MKAKIYLSAVLISFLFLIKDASGQGFLKADGKRIVNNNGNFLIRAMGLGGWMLQEPYMLQLSGAASTQHEIKQKIKDLVGPEKTATFYKAWLKNFITKGDVDSMAAWGFNAVRLPMHYNLFTLPVDEEPVAGKDTWIEDGFALTDSLLSWCRNAKMYLILDLHAAPGGQGADIAISDRDASKPSLWQSEAAQQKTIALWKKLAGRYASEPWIGGYDLINEPNWGFEDSTDKNGLKEGKNEPLKNLMMRITTAIREVDKNHMIIIEGNGWGNNYKGMFPLWDSNIVISFHKYWNYNDPASIQHFLQIREQNNAPIWCGESGENSNTWFQNAITLLEENNIGWAWWPLKKMGINNPLQVKGNEAYSQLLHYWKTKNEKPSPDVAFSGLMQLAADSKIGNTTYHKDVIDAMFRQIHTNETVPFKKTSIQPGAVVFAVDYDLGKTGFAYYDTDTANYRVATNINTVWNKGNSYRNDGVDIRLCKDTISNGYCIGWTASGEWMQYTLEVAKEGYYDVAIRSAAKDSAGQLQLIINEDHLPEINMPQTAAWTTTTAKNIFLKKGKNIFRVKITEGGSDLNYFQFLLADKSKSKSKK